MNYEQKDINSFQFGQGEPIVFQHGLAANIEQIKSLLFGLKGYSIYGIDCPGHGNSPLNSNEDVSFATYADDLNHFVKAKAIDHAIFGGLSMGAGIALNFAIQYPDRVKALILLRPAWLHTPSPSNLHVLLKAIPFMEMQNGIEHFKTHTSFQKINKVLPKAGQSVLGIFGKHQQSELPLVINRMVNDAPYPSDDYLDSINCPTLIIGCADDPLHPYSIAESIHQKLKGSELEKVVSKYIDENTYKKTVRNLILNFIQRSDLK